jgi:ribonuclease BN (tRNA processing enzyme)
MPEPITMYKRRATKLCLIGFLIVGISIFFVLFRPVNCFASASAMEVLFLGTGGSRPDGRAASCNLILVDGQPRFFVDVGSGAFARLGELRIDIDKVDTIFLTHLHVDHTADLPSMIKARVMLTTSPVHFAIYGPSGANDYPSTSRFMEILFGPGGAWAYLKHFGAPFDWEAHDLLNDLSAAPIRVSESKDGLRVTAVATHHGDAPALAYRVDFNGRSVTFSGDIDPTGLPNLQKLAEKTNLLVFNCAVLDPPGSPPELYTRHSPPKRVGELARAARVDRLILTHIPPLVERAEKQVSRSIGAQIDVPMSFAEDKMRVTP